MAEITCPYGTMPLNQQTILGSGDLILALDSTPTSIRETTGNLNIITGNYGKLWETTGNCGKLQKTRVNYGKLR